MKSTNKGFEIKSGHDGWFNKVIVKSHCQQVVTVLANLAANANIRHDIQNLDGVGFLLAMLETKMTPHLSQAEIAAAERVQKKSAIALSR